MIPESRALSDGRLMVPHSPFETRVLRGLGYRVPSPIHYGYDWAGDTPFKAQKATAAMLVVEPKAFVLSTMGTGKTRSVLYAYDYLRKIGSVGKMLVVAPLSTLNFTWAREIFFQFPGYNVGIVHGPKEKRLKILNDSRFDIYVINHDGVKILQKELQQMSFDIIAIDEVAAFRNHKSGRHKAMAQVVQNRRYVWGLTGTPTPKAPTDAFGIIRLITPTHKSARSFARFRDELMQQVSQFRWVPRAGAEQKVYDYMQPAVRFTMDDCVDMPPVLHSDREVTMDPKQEKAYQALKNYCFSMADEGQITAANEGVLVNKLIQVSSGCVYNDKRAPVILGAANRLKVCLETVLETENKSIVFCPFIPLVSMVADHLRSHGVTAYEITGATAKGARDKIFSQFQDHPERVVNGEKVKEAIVAHPGTMAHGLTLTKANLVLWYAPTSDLEIYEQANARIARPGQTSEKVQIVHLVGSAADKGVYRRLKGKQKIQGALLDLFEE